MTYDEIKAANDYAASIDADQRVIVNAYCKGFFDAQNPPTVTSDERGRIAARAALAQGDVSGGEGYE